MVTDIELGKLMVADCDFQRVRLVRAGGRDFQAGDGARAADKADFHGVPDAWINISKMIPEAGPSFNRFARRLRGGGPDPEARLLP